MLELKIKNKMENGLVLFFWLALFWFPEMYTICEMWTISIQTVISRWWERKKEKERIIKQIITTIVFQTSPEKISLIYVWLRLNIFVWLNVTTTTTTKVIK